MLLDTTGSFGAVVRLIVATLWPLTMSFESRRWPKTLYYPICIGNILAHRYRIEHKLGHGGFSTVWMARDIRKGKDVALKIMVSGDVGEHELAMQREIVRSVRDTSKFVTYLATFTIPGYLVTTGSWYFLCEARVLTPVCARDQSLLVCPLQSSC